jgi:hypothetical protein
MPFWANEWPFWQPGFRRFTRPSDALSLVKNSEADQFHKKFNLWHIIPELLLPSPPTQTTRLDAGWSSPVARQAHNLKVVGSNPTPATKNLDLTVA